MTNDVREVSKSLGASVPVSLAPKSDVEPRNCLVQKKSRVSILSMGSDTEKNRGKENELKDVLASEDEPVSSRTGRSSSC